MRGSARVDTSALAGATRGRCASGFECSSPIVEEEGAMAITVENDVENTAIRPFER